MAWTRLGSDSPWVHSYYSNIFFSRCYTVVMKCPACDIETTIVQVVSHYGTPVFINQCQNCGGIWFDSDELFRISPKEGDVVDVVDFSKVKALKEITDKPLSCPHDGSTLAVFQDINFPKNLVVENCPLCGGFWFNQGEFKQFEDFREEKIKTSNKDDRMMNPELEKQINKLLDMHSSQNEYTALSNLGKALSTPVQTATGKIIGERTVASETGSLAASVLMGLLVGMVNRN